MSHPDNNGLAECLHLGEFGISLKDAFVQHCDTVSIADFLVIAGQAAITLSRKHVMDDEKIKTKKDIEFMSKFKFGRTTATECNGSAHLLPNPEDGCAANKRVFVDNLELSW